MLKDVPSYMIKGGDGGKPAIIMETIGNESCTFVITNDTTACYPGTMTMELLQSSQRTREYVFRRSTNTVIERPNFNFLN